MSTFLNYHYNYLSHFWYIYLDTSRYCYFWFCITFSHSSFLIFLLLDDSWLNKCNKTLTSTWGGEPQVEVFPWRTASMNSVVLLTVMPLASVFCKSWAFQSALSHSSLPALLLVSRPPWCNWEIQVVGASEIMRFFSCCLSLINC